MKKQLTVCLLALLPMLSFAHSADSSSGFHPQLNAYLEYGYNYTWRSYGDLEVQAQLPINPYFEMDAVAHLSTANLYTLSADLRPKFPLPYGNMYVETKLIYRAVVRNRIHNMSSALSIGYKCDYVRFQLGAYIIMFGEFNRDWHSNTEVFIEAPSMIYALEAWVRPQTSVWNLNLRISNYNDYSIERVWQPLFAIGGRYDINNHLKMLAEVELKPTGMFHLDASFYGITARVGVGYKF